MRASTPSSSPGLTTQKSHPAASADSGAATVRLPLGRPCPQTALHPVSALASQHVFFDDLHILRVIDRCEREGRTGPLSSGTYLLQEVLESPYPVLDDRTCRAFIRELELAEQSPHTRARGCRLTAGIRVALRACPGVTAVGPAGSCQSTYFSTKSNAHT